MTISILIQHYINKFRKYWWLCWCGTYNQSKANQCIWCGGEYKNVCRIEILAGPTVEI